MTTPIPSDVLSYYRAAGVHVEDSGGDWYKAKCPNGGKHKHDDRNASASIAKVTGFFKCHKCGLTGFADQLAKQFGWPVPSWNRHKSNNTNADEFPLTWKGYTIIRWHHYTDEHGSILYSKGRYSDATGKKQFLFWCRGSAGFKNKKVRRVPYRLHRLVQAEEFIDVEGESDVEAGEGLGFVCTTTDTGARGNPALLSNFVKPRQRAVVVGDEDTEGEGYRLSVLTALYGKVASLKSVHLPDLQPGEKDLRDWINARRDDLQGAAEKLSRIIEDTPEWKPQDEPKPELQYIEFAPSFLAVEDPPASNLIAELLPEAVIALLHGEPRTRKSWGAQEIAIAAATGTPPFGLERFKVREPFPVLYSSQEDSVRDVRLRAKAILKGRGIERFPEPLAFAVHKGINLESVEWQENLIRDINKFGFRLVFFDPIRRFALDVDRGPAEVRAITAYLRKITVETGATIVCVHHDVKPNAQNHDDRRRSHKASGGDWFAAAECPIAFELVDADRTLVIPEDYKLSVDPEPFSFRLKTDDPHNPTSAQLIGETTTAEDAKFLAIQQKILEYLAEHSAGASGSAIIGACRIRREDGFAVLDRLLKSGDVDCIGLGGKGKKKTWFLRDQEGGKDGQ